MKVNHIAKAYKPSAKLPRIALRIHHDRRKFQMDDTGYITTGYNLNAIEVCCRPLGGVLVGVIADKWKPTNSDMKAWRQREHRP